MSDKNIAWLGWEGGMIFGGVQECAEFMKKIDIQVESGNTGLLFVLGNMLLMNTATHQFGCRDENFRARV